MNLGCRCLLEHRFSTSAAFAPPPFPFPFPCRVFRICVTQIVAPPLFVLGRPRTLSMNIEVVVSNGDLHTEPDDIANIFHAAYPDAAEYNQERNGRINSCARHTVVYVFLRVLLLLHVMTRIRALKVSVTADLAIPSTPFYLSEQARPQAGRGSLEQGTTRKGLA